MNTNDKQLDGFEEPIKKEQKIGWEQVISQIAKEISEYYTQKARATLQQFKWVIIIFVAILASITLLAYLKILSSDSVAFIIGTIVGYVGGTLRVLVITKEKGEE